MRVYLSSGIPKIKNESTLIKRSTFYTEIYSSDGIFRVQNNKLFQFIPLDKEIEEFSIGNLKFFVDKSEMIKKSIMTLPYNHQLREIEQIDYKFNSISTVSLIILYSKKKVIDIYFLIKSDKITNLMKNNIQEYISLLDIN
jgi:hypothetical protein